MKGVGPVAIALLRLLSESPREARDRQVADAIGMSGKGTKRALYVALGQLGKLRKRRLVHRPIGHGPWTLTPTGVNFVRILALKRLRSRAGSKP